MDINKLNRRLNILGYSVCVRNMIQRSHLMMEYLLKRFWGKVINSGSVSEGSLLDGSDTDAMEVVNGLTVNEDNENNGSYGHSPQYGDLTPIYISRNECRLGYCRLKVNNNELNYLFKDPTWKVPDLSMNKVDISKLIKRNNNACFILSKLFRENILPSGYTFGKQKESTFTSNGPATTYANVDTVKCLKINQWPDEAIKWRTRKRTNNWPSKVTLDSLEKDVSCYVVPVGSKSSRDQDMEWRISFTEIERHLIWSMNDTQFKCFVLLKALNKQYLKDIISSYHIKNVALWLCEECSKTDWRSELLVDCVQKGLLKLAEYVELGFLPHYIIPENNLFLDKSHTEIEEATKLINAVLENLDIKVNSLTNLLYQDVESQIASLYSDNIIRLQKYNSLEQSHSLIEYSKRCCIPLAFNFNLNFDCESVCKDIEKDFGKDGEEISPCIRLAFTTLELRECHQTDWEIDKYITKILKLKEFDYLTVPLTCAIIYSEYEMFSEVRNHLLPKLEDNSDKYYITPCNLFPCSTICLKSGTIKEYLPSIPSSIGRHNLLTDFNLNWHERDNIPHPLKLQIYLLGPRENIRCNPLILSLYLLYFSAFNLKLHVEMDLIQVVFKTALSIPDEYFHMMDYVHLNLFGYLMYISGDITLAFSYFAKSFLSEPVLKNAAIYHMAIMINDILQK
ncbi:uncharacterized protein LOC132721354 [Ruditapes philippinarum]|uniref:uncharacterized protein LOC132721354 n=1 Tax=Ruditapes philippinarum TaxID=129788 RepID=UPI00295C2FAC|nr:uncharacterized protein LOC132721354 [Ruditapes philippinarum]